LSACRRGSLGDASSWRSGSLCGGAVAIGCRTVLVGMPLASHQPAQKSPKVRWCAPLTLMAMAAAATATDAVIRAVVIVRPPCRRALGGGGLYEPRCVVRANSRPGVEW